LRKAELYFAIPSAASKNILYDVFGRISDKKDGHKKAQRKRVNSVTFIKNGNDLKEMAMI
jgi:hypothetical protein